MTSQTSTALPLSLAALRVLRVLNVLTAVAIAVLLVSTVVAPDFMWRAIEAEGAARDPGIAAALRAIAMLGLVAAAVMHLVLTQLEAIVGTVRDADPFIATNTRRIDAIAWAVLGLEVLHACVAAVAAHVRASGLPIDIEWDFSATRILTALMLFVLARVFDAGARMRADLHHTV